MFTVFILDRSGISPLRTEFMAAYKIVGADQKEYGPVTEEQIRQWIAEGRANAQSIARLDDGPWKPLSTFPEFAGLLGTAGPVAGPPPIAPPPVTSDVPVSASGAPLPASGMAIAGLSCSILGLFCCGPVFSTLGLVFSVLALSQINQNPGKFGGRAIAVAGIAVGLVGYAIFAVLLFSGVLRRAFKRFPRYI
jgi:Domain of unknown function (DUF4190)